MQSSPIHGWIQSMFNSVSTSRTGETAATKTIFEKCWLAVLDLDRVAAISHLWFACDIFHFTNMFWFDWLIDWLMRIIAYARFCYICRRQFLAERTNGHACYSVASVCLSICDVCIVAKRCIIEQRLLLAVYSVSQKKPYGFLNFFPNGWKFLINFYTPIIRSFLH